MTTKHILDLSSGTDLAEEARLEAIAGSITWTVVSNEYQDPDARGADAYIATANDLPGFAACGPTKEEAERLGNLLVARTYQTASPERAMRLDATRAQVQFNHRISVQDKAAIARRAAEANMTVRQFVLHQCLHAPIVPPIPREKLLAKIKSIAARMSEKP